MKIDFPQLRDDLRWLRSEDGVVPESQATAVLARILQPLLSVDGFELSTQHGAREFGVDLIAKSSVPSLGQTSIGIEYKHHGLGRPIDIETVQKLLGLAVSVKCDRLILIGRFGFTDGAREASRQVDPVSIELLDLAGIEAWISRLEEGDTSNAEQVQLLIRSLSHKFAELVAADPETLNHLEWRDLERLIARVMEGLGFQVTLTPPSKDGAKDLILTCIVKQGEESFIVELKHWRSGKRVGKQAVSDFLQVVVGENRTGGLFLSTSGYAGDAFQGLTQITRQRLRIGDRTKVVLLVQTYIKACSGLWSPPTELPQILFEATL